MNVIGRDDLSVDLVTRLRAAGCVFAEDEARLLIAETSGSSLEDLVTRRIAGEPLEHVLGWAQFHGRRYVVGPGVFVPRPRTESLVDRAVSLVAEGDLVVDLCCGSGAVGAAIARARSTRLIGIDVDDAAVEIARRNLEPVGGIALTGDLFAPLGPEVRGAVRLIVVIAPYVPTEHVDLLPHEARDYEPRVALDGGADGLDLLRRVAAQAADWLSPGGHLITEVATTQAAELADLLIGGGLRAWVEDDESAIVIARAPELDS